MSKPVGIHCDVTDDKEVIPHQGYEGESMREDGGYHGRCNFKLIPGMNTEPDYIIAQPSDSPAGVEPFAVAMQLEIKATCVEQVWVDGVGGTVWVRDSEDGDSTAATTGGPEWETYLGTLADNTTWVADTLASQLSACAYHVMDAATGHHIVVMQGKARVSLLDSQQSVPFAVKGYLSVTIKSGEYAGSGGSCRPGGVTAPPDTTECEPDTLEFVGAFAYNMNYLGPGFIEYTDVEGPPGMLSATVKLPFVIPAGGRHSNTIDFPLPDILDPGDPVDEWGLRFKQTVVNSLHQIL